MFNKPIEIEYDILSQRYKIKNTRLTLEFISQLIENGWSIKEITENYPQLDENKISQIIRYKENKNKSNINNMNNINIRKVLNEIFSR